MANFFGVEVDTSNMTLEELEETRIKIRRMLIHIELQIQLRKTDKYKHLPTQSLPH